MKHYFRPNYNEPASTHIYKNIRVSKLDSTPEAKISVCQPPLNDKKPTLWLVK